MNKLIKIGLASLMAFTIGCSSKKNDSQTESNTTAQQPKQYVAEVSNPYVDASTLLNKELTVSYQFENKLSKEGDFPTISFLHLTVYKGDTVVGYQIIMAKDSNDYLKEGDYDMIIGRTDIPLDTEVKRGDKLRIVGEANVFYADDKSKNTTLTDEIEYRIK